MTLERQQLGRRGEDLAAEFLIAQGFQILGRNLRYCFGEIDLLAQDDQVVVVVEVKTQKTATYSDPVYKVDRAKQRKLHQLASLVAIQYSGRNVRVDVVTISWNQAGEPIITHLENVLS